MARNTCGQGEGTSSSAPVVGAATGAADMMALLQGMLQSQADQQALHR